MEINTVKQLMPQYPGRVGVHTYKRNGFIILEAHTPTFETDVRKRDLKPSECEPDIKDAFEKMINHIDACVRALSSERLRLQKELNNLSSNKNQPNLFGS